MSNITEQLADALTLAASFIENVNDDTPDRNARFFETREAWRNALAAYDAHKAATPAGEVKSNRAWREECQQLRAQIASLPFYEQIGTTRTGRFSMPHPPVEYVLYTAETYVVLNAGGNGESGWCVKHGDDTLCDIYLPTDEGEAVAKRIAALLNKES